jgi:GGDEF domain-containing protein
MTSAAPCSPTASRPRPGWSSNGFKEPSEVHNDRGNRPYTLSVSIGMAAYDPDRDRDIDELIERADRSMMYREKTGRTGST